jgi:all-trans-8'-apo-beta-carotenal 15,15'-oxygenase
MNRFTFTLVATCILSSSTAFIPSSFKQKRILGTDSKPLLSTATDVPKTEKVPAIILEREEENQQYWSIGPTQLNPRTKSLPDKILHALKTGSHPEETQDELGSGVFLTRDWRRAWYSYGSLSEPNVINDKNGYAEYIIEDIEGTVPDDLEGCLYRIGPGKFGIKEERVQHVLDADGLVLQISFPPAEKGQQREFKFKSKFVETDAMVEEEKAGKFLYRSTFGTGPIPDFFESPKKGLNADPWEPPLLARILGRAFKTTIKNSANTQIISFGGKLLALFEAGLPHRLDPATLQTLGEDTMGGMLPKNKLPVKLKNPPKYLPDFIGGAAFTAHPNVCPDSGNLVGWHWSQVVDEKALQVTFTEFSATDFSVVQSETHLMSNCELAPHDMAMTENVILLQVNSLKMNQASFLSGVKGPASALAMDGRGTVYLHVFPRPTSKNRFEPFFVEVPPCFSIHFSHAYEDEKTGNIVSFFSGWPPSDSKDFLGAWGGHSPLFSDIPPTFIWRLEIDPKAKKCVDLNIAPGAKNVCAEHPLVHPNFNTKRAQYVYAVASNLIGDSTAPCGYCKLKVEDGSSISLEPGVKNTEVDAYWFGTRCFAGEPLIVPKKGSNLQDENAAYLLGMVNDCVRDRSAVAIFDLERDLKEGPVAMMMLKSSVPHGLHGCFAKDENGSSSVFC